MGSPVDVSSIKPAVVTATAPDGTKTEVLRVPLREVFEIHEDPGVTDEFGRCDSCGAACDKDGCTVNQSHQIALSGDEPQSYRLSWWHKSKEFTAFELHTPWWISGSKGDSPEDSIVACVKATSEEDAWAQILASYDTPPESVEKRFCDPYVGPVFSERFPRADWMKWDD